MKLIADSGSTKTAWALLDGQGPVSMYDSVGLNPLATDAAAMRQTLEEVSRWVGTRGIEEVYFFGAGCGTVSACSMVRELLEERFPGNVHVDSDLLGACLSVYSRGERGLCGILGTGSNACRFDGERVADRVPSLGYLLGDEGSGNHIGRLLLKGCLEGTMPEGLRRKMVDECGVSYEVAIDRLYHQPRPNAFLASLAPFALRHREEAYVGVLLREAFGQYFRHQVLPLGVGELRLVGSVAYYFRDEISDVANSLGISLLHPPMRAPVEGLCVRLL